MNHIFSVSFVVPDCEHADPQEAWENERDKVLYALRKRLYELTDEAGEYLTSIDHLASY